MPLIRQRQIWWPTWPGWILLLALLLAAPAWWSFHGEAFLARTQRVEANVLAVEGWIDREAVHAAAVEYAHGGYDYVVSAGGMSDYGWVDEPDSYAELVASELERLGVAPGRILVARAEADVDRTFQTAVSVRQALEARGIGLTGVNVFTETVHARRSRIVFQKVFASRAGVGVVAWLPPGYRDDNWRATSARAKEFIVESFGYGYELLWDSGR